MKDLIDYLYQKDELHKPYNLASDNCKDFAKRIFDEFAKSKYLTFSIDNIENALSSDMYAGGW